MTLNEMQIAFQTDASFLGEYQLLSKTELANGYCDVDEKVLAYRISGDLDKAEEYEILRSSYYSALMLRYWYKIFEWRINSYTLNLQITDFVDWLSDSLYVAFYYRVWRYKFQAVVREGVFVEYKKDENGNKIPNKYYYENDPDAPDKIINRCCGSMRGRVFQFHNKDKRKVDTQTYSLDTILDEKGDYAIGYIGGYTEDKKPFLGGAYSLVQTLLDRGENLEALIVHSIANYDNYKKEKHVTFVKHTDIETGKESRQKEITITNKFNPRKLVKHLNSIGEDFIYNFCENYKINDKIGSKILNSLKNLSNVKLYKVIQKTLEEIRQSPELLECVI